MNSLLDTFRPITLQEMSDVKLMNRIDTKFVTNEPMLMRLLEMASSDYSIQDIGGERNFSYDTTYFDTCRHDMFLEHQHGHAGRQKIRFRTYVGSNLQFMEVKTKNNHGRTKKKRIEVGDMDISDPRKTDFLGRHLRYSADSLHPSLHNSFRRITLVNSGRTERLTIDTGLAFDNPDTGQSRRMQNLVIIELKRDGLCPSPVLAMLRQLRIKPHGFSKYCMGIALTGTPVPLNNIKQKLRDVEKIAAVGLNVR